MPSPLNTPALACALACDSHLHIYDSRWPSIGDPARVLPQTTADDYRRLQTLLGTTRAVVVTPTVYGTDNRVTLDAIQRLGAEHTRGVAVLHPEVDERTLDELHAGGVRGIRFTLFDPATAVTRFDMVEPLAARVAERGWHVQLHWRADQILEHAALLQRLRCTLVLDHFARIPATQGAAHPAFAQVARLLDTGRCWVKLSAPYLNPGDGHAEALAIALCAIAPERLVWGSDWPHPTERARPVQDQPDDVALLQALQRWVPDAALRERVLVHNPAQLYDFAPAAASPPRSTRT